MTRAIIERMSPFFIVSDVAHNIAFYEGKLGFEVWNRSPVDVLFFGRPR